MRRMQALCRPSPPPPCCCSLWAPVPRPSSCASHSHAPPQQATATGRRRNQGAAAASGAARAGSLVSSAQHSLQICACQRGGAAARSDHTAATGQRDARAPHRRVACRCGGAHLSARLPPTARERHPGGRLPMPHAAGCRPACRHHATTLPASLSDAHANTRPPPRRQHCTRTATLTPRCRTPATRAEGAATNSFTSPRRCDHGRHYTQVCRSGVGRATYGSRDEIVCGARGRGTAGLTVPPLVYPCVGTRHGGSIACGCGHGAACGVGGW
jgi:hypothetical protein